MLDSRHIFESQCDPDVRVTASWAVANSDELFITISAGRARSDVFLGRQDAEAMARAILGIADPPILEWDALAYENRRAAERAAVPVVVAPARYAELRSLS